jgi:peptide deformylase
MIFTIKEKKEEAFLRARTLPFVFEERGKLRVGGTTLTTKEVTSLIVKMKKSMYQASGVGLSANQIGLPYQLFVASVHTAQGEPKFYAIFNPVIEKTTGGMVTLEEGCLSIPNTYGDVSRARQVVLRGFDKHGKPLKIKAWDLLARVFQHEVDHLNGKLFVDHTKSVRHITVE